ncbi:DNA replication protein DnaD [Paenibacillus tarimensis]
MAERRMISKVISISEKVNTLSLFGRLLYTWMIPHTDDFGRLPGSPAKVRALIVPMGDETVKDVESALSDMQDNGLIEWYEVDGEKFIQITNFDEHQSGLHKRTNSKFPDPPRKEKQISNDIPEVPGNSGNFRSELELELEEKKNTATTHERENKSTTSNPEPQTVQEAHSFVFGGVVIPSNHSSFLLPIIQTYGDHYAIELILETGEAAGKPSLRYMQSVHDNWSKVGIRSRADAKTLRPVSSRGDPGHRPEKQAEKASKFAQLARELEHDEIRSG